MCGITGDQNATGNRNMLATPQLTQCFARVFILLELFPHFAYTTVNF